MPASAGVFDCYKRLNRGCFTRAVVFQCLFVVGFFVLFAVALASFQNEQLIQKEAVEMPRNITEPGANVILFTAKITIVGIDPQSNALRITSSISPPPEYSDSQGRALVGYTFFIGSNTVSAALGANAQLSFATQVTLDGDVLNYPFDEYRGAIELGVFLTTNASDYIADFTATLSNNPVYGFQFEVLDISNPLDSSAEFTLNAARTTIFKIYPGFMIVAFWIVILSMGYFTCNMVIWTTKKIDPPIVGVFPGLLFALPAFRNTAPTSPPIGCLLDFAAFYWAMLVAICCLVGILFRYISQPNAPAAAKK